MNMALVLMAKAFKLNYSTPTNNNQRISSNPHNRQIAQPGMNIGQDRQMQMVGGNGGNQFRQYVGQNNPNGNGNVVAARAEGNAIGNNGNQIRCYNCRGLVDLDKIEEVNANYILMANLQQASTSGTQTDKALIPHGVARLAADGRQIATRAIQQRKIRHRSYTLALLVDVAIVVLSSVAIVEEGKATVVKEGGISTFAEVIEDRVSVKGEDFAIVTLL
ncbi:hypothetical protein Tco_1399472 [Tanacetum coccineum]